MAVVVRRLRKAEEGAEGREAERQQELQSHKEELERWRASAREAWDSAKGESKRRREVELMESYKSLEDTAAIVLEAVVNQSDETTGTAGIGGSSLPPHQHHHHHRHHPPESSPGGRISVGSVDTPEHSAYDVNSPAQPSPPVCTFLTCNPYHRGPLGRRTIVATRC